jgi:hypothetical protein
MAESSSGGGNTFLAFMVGGLLVVVLIVGFFMLNGRGFGPSPSKAVDVTISAPKIEAPKPAGG